MAKKHDLSVKKIRLSIAVAEEICLDTSSVSGSRSLLGQLDVPYTQNFEIWNP
jgi:hypothetical protein